MRPGKGRKGFNYRHLGGLRGAVGGEPYSSGDAGSHRRRSDSSYVLQEAWRKGNKRTWREHQEASGRGMQVF